MDQEHCRGSKLKKTVVSRGRRVQASNMEKEKDRVQDKGEKRRESVMKQHQGKNNKGGGKRH